MRIGLIGFGTVGQGVAELLARHARRYTRHAGAPIGVECILVRDPSRARDISPGSALVTDDADAFFNTPFDLLVEVAGGIDPVRSYVLRALESGRDVVSANKALIAAHPEELLGAARRLGRLVGIEATVAGVSR